MSIHIGPTSGAPEPLPVPPEGQPSLDAAKLVQGQKGEMGLVQAERPKGGAECNKLTSLEEQATSMGGAPSFMHGLNEINHLARAVLLDIFK